jgi:YCII-related domain-containing protein
MVGLSGGGDEGGLTEDRPWRQRGRAALRFCEKPNVGRPAQPFVILVSELPERRRPGPPVAPLDTGARITNARGKLAVLDGLFAESKEVIGGYAIFEVKDRDEGLALGVEFMQLHIDHMPGWDGVLEMRQVAGSQTHGQ